MDRLARAAGAREHHAAVAHVLEFVGKARLDASHWLTVQQNLYIAFGPIGGACELLAVAFTWIAVWQRPRGSRARRYTLLAAIAVSVGLMAWALIVSPMNTVLNGWSPDSVPPEWTRVRNRWETGHATQAVLFFLAFIALAIAQRRDNEP